METTATTTAFRKACDDLALAVNSQLFDGSRSFFWLGGAEGGACDFDDGDIICADDMLRILERGMTYDEYAEWRDANTDNAQYINLASWTKGLRHDMIGGKPREPQHISEEARAEADVAFALGAETAKRGFLNSLWHDREEEPREHSNIVYIDDKGNVWSEYDYYADNYEDAHHKGWQSFISTAGTLIKWCYLSDILPEKGGDK